MNGYADSGALVWLSEFPEPDRLSAFRAATSGGQLLAVEYLPAEDCFFSGEDPVNLFRQLAPLHGLRIETREPWPAADALDPYRCILRFLALTTAPRAEVESLFRYVIEQLSIFPIAPQRLMVPGGEADSPSGQGRFSEPESRTQAQAQPQATIATAVTETTPVAKRAEAAGRDPAIPGLLGRLSPLARDILASQRIVLELQGDAATYPSRVTAAARTIANVLRGIARQGDLEAWDAAVGTALAEGRSTAALAELDRLLGSAATVVPTAEAAAPDAAEARRSTARVLKVDQAKVDALMNLIGELVVSKNSLPFLAKRAETIYGSRGMAREIKDLYGVIDRLAQEMQTAIMAVRMLPVSEVLARFPRLVRDLARKLGKRVELVIEGEDTAADKNIIEVLGDPLLHILRNALDHGVETPEQRLAVGKPPVSQVRVRACHESDQVVIEVSDDGRGIDAEKVRATAIARGLLDEERAAQLSEQDIINLVFAPGFSTAAQVSDLSGRGVGMDVVVSTVEKAGGTVSLTAVRGAGTTVRLALPLSMAVTRVMMIEAGGGMLFGIPIDHIAETVRINRTQIRRIKQAETFVLRDTIVPLLRLDRLLGLEPPLWFGDDDQTDAVLVVRIGGGLTGLIVDHFRESMDIILKPFEGILAGLPGYAGSALLGDGRVLLILNLRELL